ncbi:MAG: SsrA-binding protein SmpB [Dysgonamonadaceae bacterium]|jgi:SsrA-binding protein|nr:SsrA-binding protein SmpB [Dysgonamonadaceae bacterium]
MAQQNNIVIKNKKASFDYEFIETFVAGIVLTGTEIKSIRLGKASLADSYCLIINKELWVRNMYIAEYFYGTYNNHEVRKDRKLLLNRKELNKIETLSKNTGFTVIPTKFFLNEKGLAKMVIAVAKGKKSYDKRQSLREKDDKRDMERAFKK